MSLPSQTMTYEHVSRTPRFDINCYPEWWFTVYLNPVHLTCWTSRNRSYRAQSHDQRWRDNINDLRYQSTSRCDVYRYAYSTPFNTMLRELDAIRQTVCFVFIVTMLSLCCCCMFNCQNHNIFKKNNKLSNPLYVVFIILTLVLSSLKCLSNSRKRT